MLKGHRGGGLRQEQTTGLKGDRSHDMPLIGFVCPSLRQSQLTLRISTMIN